MTKMWFFGAAALACACTGTEQADPDPMVEVPYDMVLVPEPNLEEATEAAARRLSAATFLSMAVNHRDEPIPHGPRTTVTWGSLSGAPLVCGTVPSEGNICAAEYISDMVRVQRDLEGNSLETVLLHEFGHVLGGQHVSPPVPGSIFNPAIDPANARLDAAALVAICTHAQCLCLQTELSEGAR
jgi:hypothetical protein